MRGRDARRPVGAFRASLFISGLGAKETEEQGSAGIRAPSRRRPRRKNGPGLGAKETKEQGLGGFHAPRRRRPRRKNGSGLGAKETKEQGLGGLRAPRRRRLWRKNCPGLGAKETKKQVLGGFHAPSRRRSRPATPALASDPIASGQRPHRPRPAAFPSAARRQSPQPVVKSTHMSTFIFFRIIIKFTE